MNKLEKIYKEIRVKDDIEKTSIICSNLFFQTDFNFRVFISIQIPVFTDYDPYKNESLVILEIFWHYQAISSQMVSKKSTGSVIGSTMLVVKETIW